VVPRTFPHAAAPAPTSSFPAFTEDIIRIPPVRTPLYPAKGAAHLPEAVTVFAYPSPRPIWLWRAYAARRC